MSELKKLLEVAGVAHLPKARQLIRRDRLNEARSNPKLNPKISINQALAQAVEQTTDMVAGIVPNAFVSFTELEKLGINPQSGFESTPVGIYAYPAVYVLQELGEEVQAGGLPFAGDQPFANTFKVQGNIINIATLKSSEAKQYVQSLHDYVAKHGNENIRLDDIIATANKQAPVKTVGGKFWHCTHLLAQAFAQEFGVRVQAVWNKIFRGIGIDGVVDMINFKDGGVDGRGIIYPDEPCQAVFFAKSSVINVQSMHNRYSPNAIEQSKTKGKLRLKAIEQIKTMTADDVEEVRYLLSRYGQQLKKYIKDRELLDELARPSPSEQLRQMLPITEVNPEAERLMFRAGSWSTMIDYAENVLKRRWPEAEAWLIKKGDYFNCEKYQERLIKGRWPALERDMIDRYWKTQDNHMLWTLFIKRYLNDMIPNGQRWPEVEPILLDQGSAPAAVYAVQHMKSRWPEAEEMLAELGYKRIVDYYNEAFGTNIQPPAK